MVVDHLGECNGVNKLGPFYLGGFMGTLGVLIFFVHTCLVLMQSLDRQSRPLYVPFLVRRVMRIYPLAMVAIGFTIVFKLPLASFGGQHFIGFRPDFGDIIVNLFLIQNFYFRACLLAPTWSLAYEVQMYLLLPLIFLKVKSWWQALGLWIIGVLSSILILHYSSTPNLALYVPCFLAGVIAFRTTRFGYLPGWAWPIFLLGGTALYALTPTSRVKAWSSCLLLGLMIPMFKQISNKVLVRTSETVAKYSYGIYLTHFIVLWFTFDRLHTMPLAVKLAGFFGLTALSSYVLYHTIEAPMIRLGKKGAEQYVKGRLVYSLSDADGHPNLFE